MPYNWSLFKQAARLEPQSEIPVALIVDSPWLPGYAGIDYRDYYLFPEKWLEINRELPKRFPDVVWIPGYWVEYGMAAEPSAFGAQIHFYADKTPSIEPLVDDIDFWINRKPVNPQTDGLMPLVLRMYTLMNERLQSEETAIRMVCTRGPMTVASWLIGINNLMLGLVESPEKIDKLLALVTQTIINWLDAQLNCLSHPEGIMVLDDIVGMVSKRHYENLVKPHLKRIFDTFPELIRIYHNDTPCPHLLKSFADTGFDVFNFSHEVDIMTVKSAIGTRSACMGNVAPLDLGVRGTPDQVYSAALDVLTKGAPGGGMILSFGGGISPGTPPENIDALVSAAKYYNSNHKS